MTQPGAETHNDKNWYKDRYQHVLLQRKILTLVTLLSLICTLATVLVIARLTPLKTIEPFVIQIDQKSGITQTVDPLNATDLTANEAVNNFFLVQYIRAREGYTPNSDELARNYNLVRLMSEPSGVYGQFFAEANPNNPSSNAARLGRGGTRVVKFKSITYINPKLVQARVRIEERAGGVAQWDRIILLGFEYIKLTLTNEERYINPLGFRVTEYRVDEDILPK